MSTLFTILTILAILLGPIIALHIRVWRDEVNNKKKRKMDIFRTLMATRGLGLSPKHVEALNRIDVEFSEKDEKSKAIIESWKLYYDHLNVGVPSDFRDEDGWKAWTLKKEELLSELLYEMSLYFNYDFDKVHIKRAHYTPRAYSDIENEMRIIRQGFVEIFAGNKAFPVLSFVVPEGIEGKEESDN